jgi:hypothetical protein
MIRQAVALPTMAEAPGPSDPSPFASRSKNCTARPEPSGLKIEGQNGRGPMFHNLQELGRPLWNVAKSIRAQAEDSMSCREFNRPSFFPRYLKCYSGVAVSDTPETLICPAPVLFTKTCKG